MLVADRRNEIYWDGFLNDVNSETDLVHQTVVINGDQFCFDLNHQLNFRYIVCRTITIPSNSEVIIPSITAYFC